MIQEYLSENGYLNANLNLIINKFKLFIVYVNIEPNSTIHPSSLIRACYISNAWPKWTANSVLRRGTGGHNRFHKLVGLLLEKQYCNQEFPGVHRRHISPDDPVWSVSAPCSQNQKYISNNWLNFQKNSNIWIQDPGPIWCIV